MSSDTTNGLTAAQAQAFFARFRDLIDEHAAELTALDAAIGDADHGSGMQRGAQAAAGATAGAETPASAFKAAAMSFISKVGGASGPLYGTAFLRAAGVNPQAAEWSAEDLRAALQAGYDGLVQRGGAAPGDKTMLDAWQPALEALAGGDLKAAASAAAQGRDATAELVAHKGRASYLGERSRGHIDPGAASSALLFRALAEVAGDG
ncbi:dihydroxyacetone kinase subunit DhaL [Deinococcus sp. Marseille-Q6407]|uniref:dihydroxyacetone kinase subunit DhaL n=1 Tax=Deinococcus sp. Marseille-Q6407 TaxID=2969223 RepID=UPI0021C14837|nr:dihydroxyacetone kinase subunit DhaL [Deinococcus sp. Marseille-Q6407]